MKKYFSVFVMNMLLAFAATAAVPVTTDSRIKTLVYNENEVFRINVQYGFQSNIEFSKGEEIETIAIGDSHAWQVTPHDHRIFIKALEGAARTNMTVITSRYTYQFELVSKHPKDMADAELIYVVRFFYPQESPEFMAPFMTTPAYNASQQVLPANAPSPVEPVMEKAQNYNFGYSLTGPESIAPTKVFDDGKRTYLQFKRGLVAPPHMFEVSAGGAKKRVTFAEHNGYFVLDKKIDKLALHVGKEVVYVYRDGTY